MYDMIVIGAGTAGMSAAIYGRRAEKTVLMIEASMYGGQIINASEVENYPGIAKIAGYQFAMNLYEQASSLGAELVSKRVVGIEDCGAYKNVMVESEEKPEITGTKEGNSIAYQAKTVIIATGARKRKLNVEAEQRLTGRGVSYCATCDGAFFKGKTVAVYGGGNTALGDAQYLADICKKVYLIHRREELRGSEIMVKRLQEKDNVELMLSTVITDIQGTDKLEVIKIARSDAQGNGNPADLTENVLPIDGLFVAIGQEPANSEFADIIELDEQGYIRAGEDCKTNVPGIYAAGDCRAKQVRQLTTAAADGSVAAMAAVEYIADELA